MEPNHVYCGDAIKLLSGWPEGCVDLVFADPPYNIGYIYDNYNDNQSYEQYVAWSLDWMRACARVLKPDGSFYVAIGDDYAAELRLNARKLGLHLRNWIVWHYTFGQNTRTMFGRSHTHILYLTRDSRKFTFNSLHLRYPSARHTEYQDLRANPDGRVPDDVWCDVPRLCGTFKEREGHHGCQLPEALLTRIILASSNPGEVVLDPFVGSGTTAAAAKRLGRKYAGIDLSAEYVERVRQRLAATEDESAAWPTGGVWPRLHEDHLAQIYRETNVILVNLLPNQVAMRVVTRSLNTRCGGECYDVAAVAARLEQMRDELRLPKLPNDRPFQARNHVTSEGKRYVRQVARYKGRPKDDLTRRRVRRAV